MKQASQATEHFEFELDSDAAQKVDENYRQIMKKKRGRILMRSLIDVLYIWPPVTVRRTGRERIENGRRKREVREG